MSTSADCCEVDQALIRSIRYPAPREPYVGHEQLYGSDSAGELCDQFWYTHGCDLPRGHHGDHLCLNPEDEASNDYHQHGRVDILSVCSSAASSP